MLGALFGGLKIRNNTKYLCSIFFQALSGKTTSYLLKILERLSLASIKRSTAGRSHIDRIDHGKSAGHLAAGVFIVVCLPGFAFLVIFLFWALLSGTF